MNNGLTRHERNMIEALSGKEQTRSMKEVVTFFQDYVSTYSSQQGYEQYTDETFIMDILYGLGIALDPEEYKCADGFRKFKISLSEMIKE